MFTELRPEIIYRALTRKVRTCADMTVDAALFDQKEFAAYYASTIRRHYAQVGWNLGREECFDMAARLWRWLRET